MRRKRPYRRTYIRRLLCGDYWTCARHKLCQGLEDSSDRNEKSNSFPDRGREDHPIFQPQLPRFSAGSKHRDVRAETFVYAHIFVIARRLNLN